MATFQSVAKRSGRLVMLFVAPPSFAVIPLDPARPPRSARSPPQR